MVDKENKVVDLKRTPTQKKFFFVDGKLYRELAKNKGTDLLSAWCFEDENIVHFSYTDVKKRAQKAFDTKEVCVFLNRTRQHLVTHLNAGALRKMPPVVPSGGTTVYNEKFGRRKWSEDHVLEMHDFYLNRGQVLADGTIRAPLNFPNRREVIAMMRHSQVFYAQTPDGKFVPVWQSQDWT